MLDTGWQANTIVPDFGKLLAALMKKENNEFVGIEYIAVGKQESKTAFLSSVIDFFNRHPDPPIPDGPTNEDIRGDKLGLGPKN